MAKGDDAVRRKRNKSMRKRLRGSESAVSARVSSIIAAKQRRKTGKRRMCQGMCFSLPSPDDPFNDRHGKKNDSPSANTTKSIQQKNKPSDRRRPPPGAAEDDPSCGPDAQQNKKKQKVDNGAVESKIIGEVKVCAGKGLSGYEQPSKFFSLCMNAIKDSWKEVEDEGESRAYQGYQSSVYNRWGIELWKCCAAGFDVLDTSVLGFCREKVTWLVSTASDMISEREEQGYLLPSPFLLYLVPTQERALQVRSVCKPLKALGIHTVSLHPGSSIEHQVNGLKRCEPEFLISTPERLLELFYLGAIDISGISILVLDGLKTFLDLGFIDKLNSIRENISGEPQVIIFGDSYNYSEVVSSLVKNLIRGRVRRLSERASLSSQTAFISQHVHYCKAEEEKILKVKEILAQKFGNQSHRPLQVLLIARTADRAQAFASSLNFDSEEYAISDGLPGDSSTRTVSEQLPRIFVRGEESLDLIDLQNFECAILLDFPPSNDSYYDLVVNISHHSVSGVLHTLFSKEDAPLAPQLIEMLNECNQLVPEDLRRL